MRPSDAKQELQDLRDSMLVEEQNRKIEELTRRVELLENALAAVPMLLQKVSALSSVTDVLEQLRLGQEQQALKTRELQEESEKRVLSTVVGELEKLQRPEGRGLEDLGVKDTTSMLCSFNTVFASEETVANIVQRLQRLESLAEPPK